MPTYYLTMAKEIGDMLEEEDFLFEELSESLSVLAQVGTNVFVNNPPNGKVDFVSITDIGGPPPEQNYPIHNFAVQVAVYARGHRFEWAYDLAWRLYIRLNRKLNLSIGEKDVMRGQAATVPQVVGLDDVNRWLITFSADFMVRGSDSEGVAEEE